MKGGSATLALTDAICFRALRLAGGLARDNSPAMATAESASFSIATLLRAAQRAVSETYHQPAALAAVAALAGRAMRAEGGRILYIGDGVAAILGMIDASEMPDTYGVPFDTVRAFVKNGWSAMENRDGDISSTSPLLQLSIHDFERDVLPTITSADAVILLGCGWEHGPAEGGEEDSDDHVHDATPQPWLWELVPQLRAQGVGSVSLVCAARASDYTSLTTAAAAASLDACFVSKLSIAGYAPGHGGLAELSLKIALNVISTFAMTQRGLVFRNRMIAVSPTNDKIYCRCVALIAELAGVTAADATTALLRSIYSIDELTEEIQSAPRQAHIEEATPRGEAQLTQSIIMPIAILLAHDPASTVVDAKSALRHEPRVSVLLRKMHDAKSVKRELPTAVSSSSSPPTTEAQLVLGLDLGTTSIKCALLDARTGKLVGDVARAPLPAGRDFTSVVDAIADHARSTISAHAGPDAVVAAVGVSQPGHIDPTTGRVEAAANLPWQDAPLREELAQRLDLRLDAVTLVEDGDAALLAELARGGAGAPPLTNSAAARAAHTVVLIVLGGGVGTSVAVGGTLHRGASNMVEGGHMIVIPDGRPCGCGQLGCVEAYASAPAIVLRATELLAAGATPSLLQERSASSEVALEARDVFEAASGGDELAIAAIGDAARALALACVNICRMWDPHVIVFAGGVASQLLIDAVRERFEDLRWTILRDPVVFQLASAGANAGVIGAALSSINKSHQHGGGDSGGGDNEEAAARAFSIRKAGMPGDRAAAFDICVQTGDKGGDATHVYKTDPHALGKRWVGPYLELEPNFAFLLVDNVSEAVQGYCLGALDTTAFLERLQGEYLPPLREEHPEVKQSSGLTPEQVVYNELHDDASSGMPPASLDLGSFPSHVHIDLVRAAQGRGEGTRLMETMLEALRAAGSSGVFIQTHRGNDRARAFYSKLGFTVQSDGAKEAGSGGALFMGRKL